jgi:hypothetical protein
MYAKIPDVVSHAQRKLISMVEKREYRGYVLSCGLTLTQSNDLYKTVIGMYTPTYGQIFRLRRFFPPSEWFYDEGEKLPKPIKFTPKVQGLDGGGKKMGIEATKETVALSWFALLTKQQRHQFYLLHHIERAKINHFILKTKRMDGTFGYLSRPNYKLVRSLRDTVQPDLWYIYPEELDNPTPVPYKKLIGEKPK